jgi:tetraacyldisaccharide 4'-kinase
MYRDRDLVCLDARLAHRVFLENLPTPILPAGPWREGPAALERAHLVLLTRAERLPADKLAALQDRLRALNRWVAAAHGFLTFSDHRTGETFPAERLEDASLLALSGLADAGGFEEALLRLGAKVAGERHGDHHFFSTEEQSAALDRARREERRIVITEKDRERLPEDFPALVARLEWRVKEEAQWAPVIDSVFS